MTARSRALSAVLEDGVRRLRDAGVADAVSDSRLLISAASGLSREDILRDPDAELDAEAVEAIAGMIGRRAAREPLSRILGRREFHSLDFEIGPATLDPRPDSETVVDAALRRAGKSGGDLRVLDIGTGSGCLLLAVLHRLPAATGVGTDIDADAAACARRNADRHGLSDRAEFAVTTWTDGVQGQFDIVLSNPPYIPAADIAALEPEVAVYDPRSALDGGPDGLDAYRAISRRLSALLTPDGAAILEIGAGQADDISAMFGAFGFGLLETHRDLAGRPRALEFSRLPGPNG